MASPKVGAITKEHIIAAHKEYARQVCEFLPKASYKQALKVYYALANEPGISYWVYGEVGRKDRYFLFCRILRRNDVFLNWPEYGARWLYERFREVEADPDGNLDFWARGHYKSSCITFSGSFQEIINDPEMTIGIFSHTKNIARDFVQQIKQECEDNPWLHWCYPDIFWADPKKESPAWSIDNGLIFKRKTNPRECSVEGWGLVDGQPIGKHFKLRIYDDVVTDKSVTTAEQIIKTTNMFELSHSLSRPDEQGRRRMWVAGTRYHYADTYAELLKKKGYKQRIYAATKDGSVDGEPVMFRKETWRDIVDESSIQITACQYLMNPLAAGQQEFMPEWIRPYEVRPMTLNVYIMCDPAGSSMKDNNCNTAFSVVGYDYARNKYLLDGACHKMTLAQRWETFKRLRKKWMTQPGIQIVKSGYEQYGMQADKEHFEEMMKIEKYHFPIEELNWPQTGGHAKDTRIRRLIPDHQNWRWFYPYDPNTDSKVDEKEINHSGLTKIQQKMVDAGRPYLVAKPIMVKNHAGRLYNLVDWFIRNEYNLFPATNLKDFMDSMSRFYDMKAVPPMLASESNVLPEYAGDY